MDRLKNHKYRVTQNIRRRKLTSKITPPPRVFRAVSKFINS